METLACNWDAATLLVFSENVFAPLIYYSHLGPLLFSLLLGIAVLFINPRALVNRILFAITFFFATWVYFDLILWASEKPPYIMFFWSAIVPIELLIYLACWYLIEVFANQGRDVPFAHKMVMLGTMIPILLFAHTSYNLLGFDYSNCDREAIEGPLVQYLYFIELAIVFWIAIFGIQTWRKMGDGKERRQFALLTTGVFLFLIAFSAGNILVSYFLDLDWSYEQYKLFGMPLFVAFITYSAVRFKTFDLKVITAQALVIALGVLVFSLLFVRTIENVRIITATTFLLVCVLGYILVRNVYQEIRQRELIEKQEKELEVINKQQENLLAFISHEVKGYLAKSQAAFAGIVQGDYGAAPEPLTKMAESGLADMRKGVDMVADILDASNLRRGTVSYEKKPFDLKACVEQVVHDLTSTAEKKNIKLEFSAASGDYRIIGDEAKFRRHVIRNLIDNSIHYTLHGTIVISLSRNANAVHFSVKDTGVGITPEDMKNLFTEGGHGKESTKVNADSTGYGLFIAKQVTEAHGGKIWAQSKGKDQGSEFIVEIPVEHF